MPRVLLVDDNPVNLKVTERLLQKENVSVDRAGDGETAVASVRKTPYELVLMDVQLPGIDGLEATRQIRDWEKTADLRTESNEAPHLFIVALTAEDRPEHLQACLNAGMDQVLQKPVNAKKIQALLHTLFEQPKSNGKTSSQILKTLEQPSENTPTGPTEMSLLHLMAFKLGNEFYAFDLTYLKKIVRAKQITPVPGVPDHILGVINVRGEIISVVDLRALLGISTESPPQSAIMITSMQGIDVGFLVDSVEDIIELPLKSIDPPMITFEKKYVDLIEGEAQLDNMLLVILNYQRIMGSETMKIHKN